MESSGECYSVGASWRSGRAGGSPRRPPSNRRCPLRFLYPLPLLSGGLNRGALCPLPPFRLRSPTRSSVTPAGYEGNPPRAPPAKVASPAPSFSWPWRAAPAWVEQGGAPPPTWRAAPATARKESREETAPSGMNTDHPPTTEEGREGGRGGVPRSSGSATREHSRQRRRWKGRG